MTPLEQIDDLAARGVLNGVTFWRRSDGWQANLQSAATGGWACLTRPTPSEALAAVLALNPICEDYDTRHGLATPIPPPEDEIIEPRDFDEAALPAEAHEDPGIFD